MAEALKFSIDGEIREPAKRSCRCRMTGCCVATVCVRSRPGLWRPPFALDLHFDRMERSAATIELPWIAPGWNGMRKNLIASVDDPDFLIRLVQTRAGRRILSIEELPVYTPTISLATVTYSPTVILNGVKSLSYAANMQVTRLAPGGRSGRGAVRSPGRGRSRAADFDDLLGNRRRTAAYAGPGKPGCSTRSPAARSSSGSKSSRASSRWKTCSLLLGSLRRLDHPRGPSGLPGRRPGNAAR